MFFESPVAVIDMMLWVLTPDTILVMSYNNASIYTIFPASILFDVATTYGEYLSAPKLAVLYNLFPD